MKIHRGTKNGTSERQNKRFHPPVDKTTKRRSVMDEKILIRFRWKMENGKAREKKGEKKRRKEREGKEKRKGKKE